jgi:hypothetical protein
LRTAARRGPWRSGTRSAGPPAGSQSLTGRLGRLTVLPLALSEIEGTRPDLVARLLANPAAAVGWLGAASPTSRGRYIDRTTRGGFPLALAAEPGARRSQWFD